MSDLAKAFISRSALRHNLQLLLAQSRGTPVCAVVKADAYGHGLPIVARSYAGLKLAFWGVATLAEAVQLKQTGARGPALIFLPLDKYEPAKSLRGQLDLMLELNARVTIVNREGLALLAAAAARRRKTAWIHIKADTGMGRNGCPAEEAAELVLRARAIPGVRVEGLYSHFAAADERSLDSARGQLSLFRTIVRNLAEQGVRLPFYHMANSGAIFNLPGARFDMVRPGIALYGYGGDFIRGSSRLRPVLRLEAPVVGVKRIGKGQACGYGSTFIARRKTRVGILPIGYADGYSRRWSNSGRVDFGGRLAPVIGRISMDLTLVDLTDLPGVEVGNRACLISNRRKDPHSVESMAKRLDTIPHEITSILGSRVRRAMIP